MLRNVFRSLGFNKRQPETTFRAEDFAPFPPLQPETNLAVLGDVHGMMRLFERMLQRLEREEPAATVVCVGDLIDRGDDSADVLRLAFDCRDRMIVLMGNHEEMMLNFLDDPEQEAGRWFRNGGLQTLASFGIAPPGTTAGAQEHGAVRDRLAAALGPDIEAWLRALPRHFFPNGNIVVTHAGADPWLPISQQPDRNLTWGHPDFGRRRRTDGLWVAHGHFIVPEPKAVNGVISVDTGAFAGGGLTGAVVFGGEVRFLAET